MSEPELAIESLLGALDLEPDNRRVRTILAITLALEGYINSSESQFIKALGVAEAHYNLGVILFEMGDIEGAEQRFAMAVQNKPALTDAHIWLDTTRVEMAALTARRHTAINLQPVSLLQAIDRTDRTNGTASAPAPGDTAMILTNAGADSVQTDASAGLLPEITPANSRTHSVRELPQQTENIAEVVEPVATPD